MPTTNTRNKTFCKYERRIENVVQDALTTPPINLTIKHVCKAAKISRQTFYAHYTSINDVIETQEQRLRDDFRERVGTATKREVVFTIMLTFVKDNSRYFSAVFNRKDLRMVAWMINYERSVLVPSEVAEHAYAQYCGSLESTIQSWILLSYTARQYKQYLPLYVNELLHTRVMRSRLDNIPSHTKPTVYATQA